eukprot:gene40720-49658_t
MASKIDYSKWDEIVDDDVGKGSSNKAPNNGGYETQNFRLYVSTLHNQAGRLFAEAVQTNRINLYVAVEQAYREILRILKAAPHETLVLLEPHHYSVFISSMINLIACLCKQEKYLDASEQCKQLSDYNSSIDAKHRMKTEEEVRFLYFYTMSLLSQTFSSMEEETGSLRTCASFSMRMRGLVNSFPANHSSYAGLVADYEHVHERVRAKREKLSFSALRAVQNVFLRQLSPLREAGRISALSSQGREKVCQGVVGVAEKVLGSVYPNSPPCEPLSSAIDLPVTPSLPYAFMAYTNIVYLFVLKLSASPLVAPAGLLPLLRTQLLHSPPPPASTSPDPAYASWVLSLSRLLGCLAERVAAGTCASLLEDAALRLQLLLLPTLLAPETKWTQETETAEGALEEDLEAVLAFNPASKPAVPSALCVARQLARLYEARAKLPASTAGALLSLYALLSRVCLGLQAAEGPAPGDWAAWRCKALLDLARRWQADAPKMRVEDLGVWGQGLGELLRAEGKGGREMYEALSSSTSPSVPALVSAALRHCGAIALSLQPPLPALALEAAKKGGEALLSHLHVEPFVLTPLRVPTGAAEELDELSERCVALWGCAHRAAG